MYLSRVKTSLYHRYSMHVQCAVFYYNNAISCVVTLNCRYLFLIIYYELNYSRFYLFSILYSILLCVNYIEVLLIMISIRIRILSNLLRAIYYLKNYGRCILISMFKLYFTFLFNSLLLVIIIIVAPFGPSDLH